jgi:hypothetical protein
MFAVLAPDVAQARELVLYTASNPQIEKEIMAAFKKAYPDIELKSVNDSTGPITERTIADQENPLLGRPQRDGHGACRQHQAAQGREPTDADDVGGPDQTGL